MGNDKSYKPSNKLLAFYAEHPTPAAKSSTRVTDNDLREAAIRTAIEKSLHRIKTHFPEADDAALWQGLLDFLAHPPKTTPDEHGKRQVLTPTEAAHRQTMAFRLAGQLADSAIKGEGRNTLVNKLGYWLVQTPNHAQLKSPAAIALFFSRWLENMPVQQRGAAR